MKRSPLVLIAALVLSAGSLVGCASSPSAAPATTSAAETASASPSATTGSNVWASPGSVTLDALPLGDGNVSTTSAAVGSVFACRAGNPNAGGAQVDGPWIHGSTWNANQKVVVQGNVSWPSANFSVSVRGRSRVIVTNDLPSGFDTGTFPIQSSDPAYQYDRNPNTIKSGQSITATLPTTPDAASSPHCLPGGAIGVLLNGVLLFDALDGPGRDAVAHEEQDLCQGHPQQDGQYHYHEVPTCLRDNATGSSTVVGWALDGYPIVVERDAAGNLPNNADLDACHGRVSPVTVDGARRMTYHYDATLEYPYTLGCFHGTATTLAGG
jgi:YHYH protein